MPGAAWSAPASWCCCRRLDERSRLNGFDLDAEIADALQAMLALAEGRIDETAFATWMRPQLKPHKI